MTSHAKGDTARLISMAVAGKAVTEISAACDLSVSTVQRRLRSREVADAIQAERRRRTRTMVDDVAALGEAAARRLLDLVADQDTATALKACSVALGSAIRAVQLVDVLDRLASLESAVADQGGDDER